MSTLHFSSFRRVAASCGGFSFVTAALLAGVGCNKTVDDATLTTNVHNALAADAAISQQPITDTVQNGIVTLSGNVSDDTASSVAAEDAAKVAGVKEVVNSLQIAGVQVAPTVVTPSAPRVARQTTVQERQAIATHAPLPPPPSSPPPPPQPAFRDVTVCPAGSHHADAGQRNGPDRPDVLRGDHA